MNLQVSKSSKTLDRFIGSNDQCLDFCKTRYGAKLDLSRDDLERYMRENIRLACLTIDQIRVCASHVSVRSCVQMEQISVTLIIGCGHFLYLRARVCVAANINLFLTFLLVCCIENLRTKFPILPRPASCFASLGRWLSWTYRSN